MNIIIKECHINDIFNGFIPLRENPLEKTDFLIEILQNDGKILHRWIPKSGKQRLKDVLNHIL